MKKGPFGPLVFFVLIICFVALSYASKRDQKSVQWTDFPAFALLLEML